LDFLSSIKMFSIIFWYPNSQLGQLLTLIKPCTEKSKPWPYNDKIYNTELFRPWPYKVKYIILNNPDLDLTMINIYNTEQSRP